MTGSQLAGLVHVQVGVLAPAHRDRPTDRHDRPTDRPTHQHTESFCPESSGATLSWPREGSKDGSHWDFYHRNLSSLSSNPDVALADAIIDAEVASGHVDPERIFVMGWSNGGFFAQMYAKRYCTQCWADDSDSGWKQCSCCLGVHCCGSLQQLEPRHEAELPTRAIPAWHWSKAHDHVKQLRPCGL